MTELKGIKIEDLNVNKATFIKLIGLLNLDLELPDDEHIEFSESLEKCDSGLEMAFYHLTVYGNKLCSFCLSFFLSDLTGNNFQFSGNCVDTCDFSIHYLLDCLYKSGILNPVNEEDNPELTPPVEDAEEPAEENKQDIELTPLERTVFEAIEDCSSLETEYVKKSLCAKEEEQERYFLGLASIETLKASFLQELISKAGLDETYQTWLKELREREAVGDRK